MTAFLLIPQTGEGRPSRQSLPTLTIHTFFDKHSTHLAVIFGVKNSPDSTVYPHFLTKKATVIDCLQQDFLWQNHCYELFLSLSDKPNSPYLEMNFAPTGEFNLYHFDGYRTPTQMPPRRLQLTATKRHHLLNCYYVRQDCHTVFWQDSTPAQQALRDLVESNFPLDPDSHRLVMLVDLILLAKNLNVDINSEVWLNPCAVVQGEQGLAYFAYQHASPPDFHAKNHWIGMTI